MVYAVFLVTLIALLPGDPIQSPPAELGSDEAIAEIQRLGGQVDMGRTNPNVPVRSISVIRGERFDDRAMALLRKFPQLQRVWIHGANISDAGMAYLADLKDLRSLSLDHCPITDAGLALNQANSEGFVCVGA